MKASVCILLSLCLVFLAACQTQPQSAQQSAPPDLTASVAPTQAATATPAPTTSAVTTTAPASTQAASATPLPSPEAVAVNWDNAMPLLEAFAYAYAIEGGGALSEPSASLFASFVAVGREKYDFDSIFSLPAEGELTARHLSAIYDACFASGQYTQAEGDLSYAASALADGLTLSTAAAAPLDDGSYMAMFDAMLGDSSLGQFILAAQYDPASPFGAVLAYALPQGSLEGEVDVSASGEAQIVTNYFDSDYAVYDTMCLYAQASAAAQAASGRGIAGTPEGDLLWHWLCAMIAERGTDIPGVAPTNTGYIVWREDLYLLCDSFFEGFPELVDPSAAMRKYVQAVENDSYLFTVPEDAYDASLVGVSETEGLVIFTCDAGGQTVDVYVGKSDVTLSGYAMFIAAPSE